MSKWSVCGPCVLGNNVTASSPPHWPLWWRLVFEYSNALSSMGVRGHDHCVLAKTMLPSRVMLMWMLMYQTLSTYPLAPQARKMHTYLYVKYLRSAWVADPATIFHGSMSNHTCLSGGIWSSQHLSDFFLCVYLYSIMYSQIAPRQNHVGWGYCPLNLLHLMSLCIFCCYFLIIFSAVLN